MSAPASTVPFISSTVNSTNTTSNDVVDPAASAIFAPSRLESLPEEVFLMIAEKAENPFLSLVCPQFYNLLETDETHKKAVKRAFKPFGLAPKKVRASNYRPGTEATYLDYNKVFGEIISQPWVVKAIFHPDKGKKSLVPPKILRKWALSAHGAAALFGQPIWTEPLGAFLSEILKKYKGVALKSVTSRIEYKAGLSRAFEQGCVPAIQALTNLDITTSAVLPGDRVYDQDPKLPQTRWVKRWSTQKVRGDIYQPEAIRFFCAPIKLIMEEAHVKRQHLRYRGIYEAYIRAYWSAFLEVKPNSRYLSGHPTQFVLDIMKVIHYFEKRETSQDVAIRKEMQHQWEIIRSAWPWRSEWRPMQAYERVEEARTAVETAKQEHRAQRAKIGTSEWSAAAVGGAYVDVVRAQDQLEKAQQLICTHHESFANSFID